MSDSVSKTIADSEEELQVSAREGKSIAEALNKLLSNHLGWPYRVRAGSAIDVDGLSTEEFSTLIYTASETEVPPAVSISAESLAGVIETIQSLDSAALKAAYEKITIAKSLRKTTGPPSPYLNSTLGIIFALESTLSLEEVGLRLDELNKAHPSHLWTDIVVVRVLVLEDERVPNPEFYPMLRGLGFANLPDQSAMGAITFYDVVGSHEQFSAGLLFHELVHVEQYRQLGIPRFSELYVRGFLNGGSYEAIPLEVNAHSLEDRFRRDPRRAFSVQAEVAQWLAEGRL